jgi:acyl-CoA thioesterase II
VPHSVPELLDLLKLEPLEVDLFRGRQPDTAMQRVFGGQVAAQALAAACETAQEDAPVHSMHAYFLRPGDTAVPIIYDVERIRDGRSFFTRRVVARQHGRGIFYATASFHVREPGYEHQDRMPAVPPPDECPSMADRFRELSGSPDDRSWEHEWAALDVRYAADSRPSGCLLADDEPARSQVWIRVAGEVPGDAVTNACLLTYVSDLTLLAVSLVPHGVMITSPELQPASLDHAMWFHRPFRADEWLLYDQHSPSANGARGLALGRVFTADGVLVATIAQEGLIRPVGRAREGLE